MGYLRALFSGWVNAMSTILILAAIVIYVVSDVGHKDLHVPPSLALLVGVAAFVFVSCRLWHKNESLASAFRASLRCRSDNLTLKWEELAELYQNAHKEEGQPATLQEPMSPVWVSSEWKVWPYRVGFLQVLTITLRQDLNRTSIPVEEWDVRISMPRLLDALRKYREQINKLT